MESFHAIHYWVSAELSLYCALISIFFFSFDFRTIKSIGMLENVPPVIHRLFSDNRACDARDARRRHKRKIACESLSRNHRNTPFASRWERFTSFYGAVIVTIARTIAHSQVFCHLQCALRVNFPSDNLNFMLLVTIDDSTWKNLMCSNSARTNAKLFILVLMINCFMFMADNSLNCLSGSSR